MQLSVVIPTYNGLKLLKQSLPLLLSALNGIKFEIIVVDNGSKDETGEYIKSYKVHKDRKFIKLIRLCENNGFTRAVNEGARTARGKYLLILNNDCIVQDKGTISRLLNKLEQTPTCVATQPVVYSADNARRIESIGYIIDAHVGKARAVESVDEFVKFLKSKVDDGRYVYGLSATCLLIKRSVFVKIGMFDERFHSYLEDVDLFLRLHKAGYQYSPTLDAEVIHQHMATSARMGAYKEVHDFKNWIRIILKNYDVFFMAKHFPSLFIERLRNLNGIIKKLIK